jgi:hypothetical protein
MAAEVDLTISQGKTFTFAFRWASLPIKYVPIEAVPDTTPLRITSAGHGIPDGWPVAIVSTDGLREVRAKNNPPRTNEYHTATLVDTDTVEFNAINAAPYEPWTSGGYLQFYSPADLAGLEARMQIRDRVGGTVLHELESPTSITLDNTKKEIRGVIGADESAGFSWGSGIYDLELYDPGDVTLVWLIASGKAKVSQEVTKP